MCSIPEMQPGWRRRHNDQSLADLASLLETRIEDYGRAISTLDAEAQALASELQRKLADAECAQRNLEVTEHQLELVQDERAERARSLQHAADWIGDHLFPGVNFG